MNAKHARMQGVAPVVEQKPDTGGRTRIDGVARFFIAVLCVVTLFVLGALGGSELERRRAVAEGAAERTSSGIAYIDGRAYRAVCMRDLKTWQDFQAISVREQAAALQHRAE